MKSTRILALTFGLALLCGATACSGSKQDDEALEVEKEGKDEAPAADAAAGETDTAAATAEADAAPPEELTPAPEPTPAPIAAAPEPAAAPAPAAAASAPVDKNRVVRFIKLPAAALYAQPSDTAATVGTLVKGDKVLIVEHNGWGMISDQMFIKLNALSKKPVGRDRVPATWSK